MQIKSSPVPTKTLTLKEIQSQFEQWRETRPHRGMIPDKLWDAAVKLSESYSVHQISKALNLNHTCLRDRIQVSNLKKNAVNDVPSFIEVNLPPQNIKECIVKMESEEGAKMKIQINDCSASNLIEFCTAFWRSRA